MAEFTTEDFSEISIEELDDWNELVLHPYDDEIGISTKEIPDLSGDNDHKRSPISIASSSASGTADDPVSSEPPAKTKKTSKALSSASGTAVKKKKTSSSKNPTEAKRNKSATTKAYFLLSMDSRKELQSSSNNTVRDILNSALTDEQFAGRHGYGSSVHKLANHILLRVEEDAFHSLSNNIVCNVLDLVDGLGQTPIGAGLQDETFKQFHIICTSKEKKGEWDTFVSELSCVPIVSNLLYQYILEKLLDFVILQVGKDQKPTESEVVDSRAGDMEHDAKVLRYIAGFIPYALLKRYKRSKAALAKEYAEILQTWKAPEDAGTVAPSFLSYTCAWIEMQNRGGLFTVTDEVFRFFWAMERISKSFLCKKNLNSLKTLNMKETLTMKCKNDEKVVKLWKELTATCSMKIHVEPLFTAIINYWAKIRIYAFVKAYNFFQTEEKKTSHKGEKSLRKELKLKGKK